MSDSIEELSREFRENVLEEHARSIGLFPIPEYPEFEAQHGMWSTVLDVILTTLRYLAPATLLTIFWGQQGFFFKLLKYIDSAFRALIYSSEEQKQCILQWLDEAGPVRVDSLDVVWRHGWIVCGVLDNALPGACAGHPPTRLSLKHAQTIADHYLGVQPVFSRLELEANNSISRHQEWKLITYLDSIRAALDKLPPPASKTTTQPTQKVMAKETHFTLNYIARGSGLTAAQVNNKVYFKIYPTAQQSLDPGEITILIHGPKETYGMSVIPPILGKAQMIRQNLLGLQTKSNYTENALPITQGITYLRNYGKNDMHKTFYIPKAKYDIEIDTEVTQDHVRVGYIANLEGNYEISITSRGQNVVGSPFSVTASNNIVGDLERDSFCLEDGEEIDIVDVKTDKKVVLRIVDFVTEKMILRENGNFEKISDEEAKFLLENDSNEALNESSNEKFGGACDKNMLVSVDLSISSSKTKKFFVTVNKIIIITRFCSLLKDIRNKQKTDSNMDLLSICKQHVPDIVNSTFNEEQKEIDITTEKINRTIIPENISVSILTEKPAVEVDSNDNPDFNLQNDCLNNNNIFVNDPFEDDNVSVDTVQSVNNPFLSDIYNEGYGIEKKFGSFIPNEFESNNSQSEVESASTKLFAESKDEISDTTTNPFVDVREIERPKTPVYKIITGELTDREDSGYINPENSLPTEVIGDLLNPFVDYEQNQCNTYQERPDFIIGAPVSLPPIINLSSSNTSTNNIDNSKNSKKDNHYKAQKFELNTIPTVLVDTDKLSDHSNYCSSFDSNLTEDVHIIPSCSPTPSNINNSSSREMSPKKDTWDSAYVSIDDNNSTSGNSESNIESTHKRSQFPKECIGSSNITQWQSDQDLKDMTKHLDDAKTHKTEMKKSEFMPIIEENEKSFLSHMKDKTSTKKNVTDTVSEAFAELNDLYDDYSRSSEVSSITTTQESQSQNLEIDYTLERNDIHVDSASEFKTDVKRQTKILEGMISEVQAHVTESVSVSRNLHVKEKRNFGEENNNQENAHTQFGDQTYTNIVSEKKKYWDEKIRQIEAKSEEVKSQQSKRRLSYKYLRRNDSLSKRRGKKIVQNFLSNTYDETLHTPLVDQNEDIITLAKDCTTKFEKLESCNNTDISRNEPTTTCFGKCSNNKEWSVIDTFKHIKVSNDDPIDNENESKSNSHLTNKQELSEKVFQAFETSPKRFFGTSRKQILNKIDTFLGLPDNENETKKINNDISHESGLVSSRISLFHSISHTEEIPWSRRKSKSMHNITHDSFDNNSKLKSRDSNNYALEDIKNISSSCDNEYLKESNENDVKTIPLKEKRAKLTLLQKKYNKSFDETLYVTPAGEASNNYVKSTIKGFDEHCDKQEKSDTSKLKSISKSEMDIFNKVETEENFEKHRSYEELPKICVKNFISHYEDVSRVSIVSPVKSRSRTNIGSMDTNAPSSTHGTATKLAKVEATTSLPYKTTDNKEFVPLNTIKQKILEDNDHKIKNMEVESTDRSTKVTNVEKDTNYYSLSDIELEIIENDPDKSSEATIEKGQAHLEYKNRFTMAKKYFQSLEELRDVKKTKKLQKSESMNSQSTESLQENKRPRKKSNIKKSRSMPSSEISKIWNQMQEEKEAESKKLVKISEKFNVDDLFEDVMEGRLSRQGSLRGIPHKKAVLETFRSMENVSDNKLNSYEMAVSQLTDFAEENKIKNAQTYLSEYPYLPTTDPSKYHSRLDANASGLITFKELKMIPRRNSVPDLRLNASFTADL